MTKHDNQFPTDPPEPTEFDSFATEKVLDGLKRLVRDATDDDRTFVPGLEAVYVAETAISSFTEIPLYRGYAVDHLASGATFPEVAWLLLRGELPSAEEYADFRSLMHDVVVDPALLDWCDAVPMHVDMVDYLRSALSLLSHFDPHPDNHTADGTCLRLAALLMSIPELVSRRFHFLRGNGPVPCDSGLSYACNTLTQLTGKQPTALQERAFEALLVVLADQTFDASSLAARVGAGTITNLYSCVSMALAAFNGRQHKPHNLHYISKLLSANSPDEAEKLLRMLMDRNRIVGGFCPILDEDAETDPRVALLHEFCREMAIVSGAGVSEDIADRIESVMRNDYGQQAEIVWPALRLCNYLHIDLSLFRTVLALGRIPGWCAHAFEQKCTGQMLEPSVRYCGFAEREFPSLLSRC